jgi:hypothetical protein
LHQFIVQINIFNSNNKIPPPGLVSQSLPETFTLCGAGRDAPKGLFDLQWQENAAKPPPDVQIEGNKAAAYPTPIIVCFSVSLARKSPKFNKPEFHFHASHY